MKKTKWSEGIEKIGGKFYQKTSIQQIEDFYVSCPYCGETTDCSDSSELIKCSICKKTFYKE